MTGGDTLIFCGHGTAAVVSGCKFERYHTSLLAAVPSPVLYGAHLGAWMRLPHLMQPG